MMEMMKGKVPEEKKKALKNMLGEINKIGMAKVKPLLTISIGVPEEEEKEDEVPSEDEKVEE